MNTEDYVSLEVAKLLKEKGFREPCNAIYYVNRSGNSSLQIMFCLNEFEYLSKHNDGFQYEYLAPSLYEAQKWLRNKHQLHISVGMCSDYSTNADGERCDEWNFWSFSTYYTTSLYHIHDYVEEYDSYEEALNAGILEALKLI